MKIRDLDSRDMYSVLISTTKGTPYRYESKAYNHLVERFNRELKYRKYEAVQWFFTNCGRALRGGHSGFSVKLQPSYWTGNDCGITSRGVKSVLDYMSENGYVEILKGSHDYRQEWLSYVSIVRLSYKLKQLFDLPELHLHIPSDGVGYPIVIKDRDTKQEIPFEINQQVSKMASEVNKYNESLAGVVIKFNNQEVPLLEYRRSFSGDFEHGGRLFAHGGSIQLVPQEYRLSYITIDDEPVAELDYSANHPRILYELMSIEDSSILENVSTDFDPYGCDTSFISIDHNLLESKPEKYNPARNFTKHAMMRALNCESFDKAFASLSNELFKDNKRDLKDREFLGLVWPDCRKVLGSICNHNHLISKHFFQDKGIWLQNLDSEIALRVIDLMLQQGEVVLCWHDSFQCRQSAKEMLRSAMYDAWKDVLKSDNYCKVDEK
jgi:hypothetical protein